MSAARLAAAGHPIFALADSSKVPPAGSKWADDGTTTDPIDAFDIALNGNFGVRCDRLMVVDVDAGRSGYETLAGLEAMPNTFRVRTANGGVHLYYLAPEGAALAGGVDKLGPGIDVKTGPRSYVVGPGSKLSERSYSIEHRAPIAPCPQWIIDRLVAAPTKAPNAGKIIGEVDTPAALATARTILETAPPAIAFQGGNDRTYKTACKIMDRAVSPEACLDLMLEVYNPRCEPEWEPDELERIVMSAAEHRQEAIGSKDAAAGFEAVPAPTPRTFEARCVADVEIERINWLWPERFALGKLSIIGGQPKRGKSQLTCAMAATVTCGGLWPDGTRAPKGSVIFITAEDDLADTIAPRLVAAGADVRKVFMFDWALSEGKRKHFDIGAHMPQLTDMIDSIGDVRLVVIDPVLAYMGAADSHKTAEVRSALMPLQALAPSRNFAGLLVTHFNKNEAGTSAMNRMAASGAYAAVARSVWVLEYDPEDPTQRRRIFAPAGANIGKGGTTGFACRVESVDLPRGISTSKLVFDGGPITVAADDLMKPRDTERRDATEFLRRQLALGPRLVAEIIDAATGEGISERTLKRAQQGLGLRRKWNELLKGWCWSLEDNSQAHDKL